MGCCDSKSISQSQINEMRTRGRRLMDCKEVNSAVPWLVRVHHKDGNSVEQTCQAVRSEHRWYGHWKTEEGFPTDDLADCMNHGIKSTISRISNALGNEMEDELLREMTADMPGFMPYWARRRACKKVIDMTADKLVEELVDAKIREVLAQRGTGETAAESASPTADPNAELSEPLATATV